MRDFSIERRVYYHNTDAGGVVYYANYLKLFEEGRTEFCLSRGIDTAGLRQKGISFLVAHVETDYKSPARYGETLTVATRIEKIGISSIHFYQEIRKDERLCVVSRTVWACVGGDHQSMPLPGEITSRLEKDKSELSEA